MNRKSLIGMMNDDAKLTRNATKTYGACVCGREHVDESMNIRKSYSKHCKIGKKKKKKETMTVSMLLA